MDSSENNRKLCPFLMQACIEDKCSLWTEIFVMRPQYVTPQKESVCAFVALVLVAGTKPTVMPQTTKLPIL